MAGNPSAHRTQMAYLLQNAAHGTSADTQSTEVLPILGSQFIPVRIIVKPTTALAGATASVYTLTWRPTDGSATGAKTIAVWSQTALAVDVVQVINLNVGNTTETTFIAASETGQGGISGTSSVLGNLNSSLICGPGGEFNLNDNGGGDSGVAEIWMEVELVSMGSYDNNPGGTDVVFLTPTTVGATS